VGEGKLVRLLVPVLVAAVLNGCFSDPLGKPGSVPTNVELLGKWRCTSVGDGDPGEGTLEILRFDDWQYYAEWKDPEQVARYRAYGTRLGDATLLNVEELDGKFTPWPWAAVRAVVGKDKKLALAVVKVKALRSSDEKGMKREIRERVHDAQIYQAFVDCTAQDD
jgi:hypothetical protein